MSSVVRNRLKFGMQDILDTPIACENVKKWNREFDHSSTLKVPHISKLHCKRFLPRVACVAVFSVSS